MGHAMKYIKLYEQKEEAHLTGVFSYIVWAVLNGWQPWTIEFSTYFVHGVHINEMLKELEWRNEGKDLTKFKRDLMPSVAGGDKQAAIEASTFILELRPDLKPMYESKGEYRELYRYYNNLKFIETGQIDTSCVMTSMNITPVSFPDMPYCITQMEEHDKMVFGYIPSKFCIQNNLPMDSESGYDIWVKDPEYIRFFDSDEYHEMKKINNRIKHADIAKTVRNYFLSDAMSKIGLEGLI